MSKKTLGELEEENETLDTEISVAQKRATLKALDRQGGKGFWRKFSFNNKLSGMDWRRAFNWLKTN